VYVSLLTLGMRGAVTRFVSQDIACGDHAGLNATLSAVALLYLIVGCTGPWYAPASVLQLRSSSA